MKSSKRAARSRVSAPERPAEVPAGPWPALWILAGLTLLAQLALCQFFTFGAQIPLGVDINPSNLWRMAYQWPPTGEFLTLNWLGTANLPPPLNPFSLACHLPAWWFFTAYAPCAATAALVMAAFFLREFGLGRPAALFGATLYAWQGDLLPFAFPAHYAYITTWFFYAAAAWAALRAERTGHWAYPLISGSCCGTMIGLAPDRGAIASLLIAALYLAPVLHRRAGLAEWRIRLRRLALCAGTALAASLAAFLALFQSYIVGVSLGGRQSREETFKLVTQYCLAPVETLVYLVPGFFGWHTNSSDGPYWGFIGLAPGSATAGNINLAISTTGTLGFFFALIGAMVFLPGVAGRLFGPVQMAPATRTYGRVLLAAGLLSLVLAWGWHTQLYRLVYQLPLMDKWRNPLKWLEIFNLAAVTLAGLGLQHLLEARSADAAAFVRGRYLRAITVLVLFLGVGLVASFALDPALAARLKLTPGFDPLTFPALSHTLHAALGVATLEALLFIGLLYALGRPDRMQAWRIVNPWLDRTWQAMWQPAHLALTTASVVIAASIAQLAWVDLHYLKPTPIEWTTASNPLVDALRREGPAVRVSVAAEDPVLNQLLLNQFQFRGAPISSLEISAASRLPDDFEAFMQVLNGMPQRTYLLAGVKHLALPQQAVTQLQQSPFAENVAQAEGYMLVASDAPNAPSHTLVELRDYFAKGTFIPRAEVLPGDGAVLARLKAPAWNPRESLLLTAPAPGIEVPQHGGPGQVDMTAYGTKRMVFEVLSAQGGYLLVNDQYNPDWQAEVNGRPVPILRADYIFRAVPVPPGAVRVEFTYAAHYRVAGLNLPTVLVNGFSDAAMLGAWIVAGVALRRWRA